MRPRPCAIHGHPRHVARSSPHRLPRAARPRGIRFPDGGIGGAVPAASAAKWRPSVLLSSSRPRFSAHGMGSNGADTKGWGGGECGWGGRGRAGATGGGGGGAADADGMDRVQRAPGRAQQRRGGVGAMVATQVVCAADGGEVVSCARPRWKAQHRLHQTPPTPARTVKVARWEGCPLLAAAAICLRIGFGGGQGGMTMAVAAAAAAVALPPLHASAAAILCPPPTDGLARRATRLQVGQGGAGGGVGQGGSNRGGGDQRAHRSRVPTRGPLFPMTRRGCLALCLSVGGGLANGLSPGGPCG